MRDEEIIELYWNRNEKAISETNQKYGTYCMAIAENILHSREDSEECVNDTWMRTWNAIPSERPGMFKQFLAKITRNLSFDTYKAKHASKRGNGELAAVLDELEECVAATKDVESVVMAKELADCINSFVGALPERECDVFLRRYFYGDEVKNIAKRYGLKESNVFVMLSRTRKKLKEHLDREGYAV